MARLSGRLATLLLSWASASWSYGLVATDAPSGVLHQGVDPDVPREASPTVKETVVFIRPDMTLEARELAISQLQSQLQASNGSQYNQSTIDDLRKLCNGCITAQQASITAATVRNRQSPTLARFDGLAPAQSTLVSARIIESRCCAQVSQHRSTALAVATAAHTKAESDLSREQRTLQRMADRRSRAQSRQIAAQRAESNKLAELQSARMEMDRLQKSSQRSYWGKPWRSSRSTYRERRRLSARIDALSSQHRRLQAATGQAGRVRAWAEQRYNQKQTQIAPVRLRMSSTSRSVYNARGAAGTAASDASAARQRAHDACASRFPGVKIVANFD